MRNAMKEKTMRKLFILLALLAVPAYAELYHKTITATTTSQSWLLPSPMEVVGLCNHGTVNVYYRLFWDGETSAAATSADHVLVAGSATAPVCISFGTARTQPAPWRTVSLLAASSTAAVHIQGE